MTDLEIPTMLLPTLVENAVTHGIAITPSGGEILIRVVREGAAIRIEVTNTGQMPVPEPRAEAVGLTNIRERLRLLYGDRASLTLQNAVSGQVVAELRRLLTAHPTIEIVGEASNGREAIDAVSQLELDLLFLDIQMPGMTGFELLEHIEDVPQVIFTTAYDRFAIKAFEVNALDYLMKPVTPERLASAVERLRPPTRRGSLEQVFVRDGERCWVVRLPEIFLFESEGNYTRVHFRSERPLIRRSLNAIEARLDSEIFFRANRAQIFNLKWIDQVDNGVAGGLVVRLRGGHTIEMSRRRSDTLREILSL
jgi:two-component system LytT family response regulator